MATTATQNIVSYYAVASSLHRPPPQYVYYTVNPSLRGKMPVKPRNGRIRTGVDTIANHFTLYIQHS